MKLFTVTQGLILFNNHQLYSTLCYILEDNDFKALSTHRQFLDKVILLFYHLEILP